MVFHLGHHVLDEAPSGLLPVRLLRVDLHSGETTELGEVALPQAS
jgi:hypothetical protein